MSVGFTKSADSFIGENAAVAAARWTSSCAVGFAQLVVYAESAVLSFSVDEVGATQAPSKIVAINERYSYVTLSPSGLFS